MDKDACWLAGLVRTCVMNLWFAPAIGPVSRVLILFGFRIDVGECHRLYPLQLGFPASHPPRTELCPLTIDAEVHTMFQATIAALQDIPTTHWLNPIASWNLSLRPIRVGHWDHSR